MNKENEENKKLVVKSEKCMEAYSIHEEPVTKIETSNNKHQISNKFHNTKVWKLNFDHYLLFGYCDLLIVRSDWWEEFTVELFTIVYCYFLLSSEGVRSEWLIEQ